MATAITIELTKKQKEIYRETAGKDENEEKAAKSRREFAAQFGDMLLKTVPFKSTVRNIFDVKTKPDGEMRFLIEPNDTIAWQMSKIGQFSRNYIEGDEVFVPTDIYQTSVYYSLDYAEDADYDVPSLALSKLNDAITRFEETQGWLLIRAAVNNAPTSQKISIPNATAGAGYFSKQLISLILLYFERWGKTLDTLYVPPDAMNDIRNWTVTKIDNETQRQIFTAGGLSSIWNVQIEVMPMIRYYLSIEDKKARRRVVLDRLFNANDVKENGTAVWDGAAKTKYAAGTLQVCYGISKQDFGIMAIKSPIKTVDDPTAIVRWEQGILARERLGFVIIDSENIVMGIVDRTNTES